MLLKNQQYSQKREAPRGAECECGAGRNVIEKDIKVKQLIFEMLLEWRFSSDRAQAELMGFP